MSSSTLSHARRARRLPCRKSGLTIEQLARKRGLVPQDQRLYWWRKKLAAAEAARQPAVLPVKLVEPRRGEPVTARQHRRDLFHRRDMRRAVDHPLRLPDRRAHADGSATRDRLERPADPGPSRERPRQPAAGRVDRRPSLNLHKLACAIATSSSGLVRTVTIPPTPTLKLVESTRSTDERRSIQSSSIRSPHWFTRWRRTVSGSTNRP